MFGERLFLLFLYFYAFFSPGSSMLVLTLLFSGEVIGPARMGLVAFLFNVNSLLYAINRE